MTVTVLTAPTARLPPIAKIHQYSAKDLIESLDYLRLIYNPEVRGTRRIDNKRAVKSLSNAATQQLHASASLVTADLALDSLRSDGFERSYAIRWLTALVSRAYRLIENASEATSTDAAEGEALLQQAASLLAICAGTASAGTVTRVFRFQHDHVPIEVQLTDVPLENQDYASVGAQTWGSAYLLAEMLTESPEMFGLFDACEGLRALELGAGTGLVGLTLGKLLDARLTQGTIVATDFYPSVLANLRKNVSLNFPVVVNAAVRVHTLDWSQFCVTEEQDMIPPFDQSFDLILGADIIYEPEHAQWIKECVEKLLRRPGDDDSVDVKPAQFHLVIPIRPTHVLEVSAVEDTFPLIAQSPARQPRASPPALGILSKDVIICEAYGDVRSRNGSGGEVEYAHYIIGWCR